MKKRLFLILITMITIIANACSRRAETVVYVMDSGNYEIIELSYLNHIRQKNEIDDTVQKERTIEAYGSIIHAIYKETITEDMHYKIHVYQGFDENGNEVLLHYSVKGEREILTKYAKMRPSNAELINIQQLSRDECYTIALETVKSLPVVIEGIEVSLSNESVIEPNSASVSGTDDRIRRTRYIFSFEWALNDIVYYCAAISIYSDGDVVVVDTAPSQDNNVPLIISDASAINDIAEKEIAGIIKKTDGVDSCKCIGKSLITTPEGKKYVRVIYSLSETNNDVDRTSDVMIFVPI